MRKLYDFKSDVSGKTDEKCDCIRMTHLTQSKNRLKHKKRKEHHYCKKNLDVYTAIKLDKVLSSDKVYSIHAILRHKKSLCLELVFVFSLNSAMKSLLYPIVILQKNKKQEDTIKLANTCMNGNSTMDLLIIFLLCTGARLGEALGLQWSKVDLFKKEIRIDQQVQAVPNTDKTIKRKYKLEIIKSTKTRHSNRTLPILTELSALLYTIKQKQYENKAIYKEKYRHDLDLVFAKDDGYFICDTVFRKHLNSRLKEFDIEHFRIHDLRHSYATRLFESGQYEPKTVSQLLGHSSIGITLDTYTHVMPTKLKEEVKKSVFIFRRYFNNMEKYVPSEMFPKKSDEKGA